MHILLETGRLRLRRFVPADADLLVALDADPEVMRYITYGQPTPLATYVETYLPRWFAIYRAQPGLGYFAAERRDTGEFLGWFHLRDDRIEPGDLGRLYKTDEVTVPLSFLLDEDGRVAELIPGWSDASRRRFEQILGGGGPAAGR